MKGQPVLVRDYITSTGVRRYFSHINNYGRYCCFADGTTEWSSDGNTCDWRYCEGVNNEEEQK